MERGDLAVSTRPSYLVVLEGVLADITPITRKRRLRAEETTGYNLHWLDIPLRRLATVKRLVGSCVSRVNSMLIGPLNT